MFSSFDPEVCLRLKALRPDSVVMFLSGGGAYAHVDSRRTSILAALEFAAGAGLDGVILETSVLREQQGMVAVARRAGLQMMTYGVLNNDPVWVRQQEGLGVHAVIVDDVVGIASAFE